jgi:hydroxymethylpyrimidine pyrophosphatase-like HAD family hydrolase
VTRSEENRQRAVAPGEPAADSAGSPAAPTSTPSTIGRPRVVGADYDGTLTLARRPSDEMLTAIARARAQGIAFVLVTGRILDELLADFDDAAEHFDALVVENGAEVHLAGRCIATASPIDATLTDALAAARITHRRGHVIVAASGTDEHRIVDEINRVGLECQVVRNRGELMILPSGINKGLGFATALAELGISPHDSVAVGDAENDHSLLAVAELGVAVGNGVESLRSAADVVLTEPDGEGVIALVEDLIGTSEHWRHRRRPDIVLGHDTDGRPVRIPARPSNIVVAAGTGDGKSYLAGLIAEQLVDLRYSVLIIDPEGDHVGLDTLRPAVVLGDDGPPPGPDVVVNLLKRSDACVVVDLSSLTPHDRAGYLEALPATIEASRRQNGRPHWVIVDEAHYYFAHHTPAHHSYEMAAAGYCLVTWRPQDLPGPVVAATDIVVALTSHEPGPDVIDLTAAVAGESRTTIAQLLTGPIGGIVIARRDQPRSTQRATIAPRRTEHFRHQHKYDNDGTRDQRGFWFRDDNDHPTGHVARGLHELELELARCPNGVIRHHAPLGDFSRWIGAVFHERNLAATIATIEQHINADSPDALIDHTRTQLVDTIHRRRHTRPDTAITDR